MNRTSKYPWLKAGIYYGLFLFVMVALVWPLVQDESLSITRLAKELTWWLAAGILFEYLRFRFTKKSSTPPSSSENS